MTEDAPLRYDRLDYTPFPKSVTLARRRAHRLLTDWGHPELAPDTALLVSELGGNAVLHGCLRDRLFRVELALTERAVRVSVSDPRGELLPRARNAASDEMFGRGLLIVGAVADRWGVTELTVGKLVWCELDVVRGVGEATNQMATQATYQATNKQEPHPAPVTDPATPSAPTPNRRRRPAARWAS
ncbi:ATP-binding protein [Streptomyces sp. ME02-8801-2C]|uniref:ATP-binding protein n=1 Tax=Streptomyces sp. ME02-8801-2C TaxID=3028680 RepID=UPI0029B6BDB7|nr:ATP-binding protein [Streptomyces sp. ME02-8801-2C]MDX3453272.1 ATP-binding protein [Streptomyces sp. ME02-8801-2C]